MQGLDGLIVLFLQGLRSEALTRFFMVFVSYQFWTVVALGLVLVVFLKRGVLRVPVVSFVLAGWLSDAVYHVIKDFVHRPRPFLAVKGAFPLIVAHGASFPSGHATFAMAVTVVLTHHFPKARSLLFVLVLFVALSRVYLGVHYPSDVLAGMVLGAGLGWLCLVVERTILRLAAGIDLRKPNKIST